MQAGGLRLRLQAEVLHRIQRAQLRLQRPLIGLLLVHRGRGGGAGAQGEVDALQLHLYRLGGQRAPVGLQAEGGHSAAHHAQGQLQPIQRGGFDGQRAKVHAAAPDVELQLTAVQPLDPRAQVLVQQRRH